MSNDYYFHLTFCHNLEGNFLNVLYATSYESFEVFVSRQLRIRSCSIPAIQFNFCRFQYSESSYWHLPPSTKFQIQLFWNAFWTFCSSLKKVFWIDLVSSSFSFAFYLKSFDKKILSPSLSAPSGHWLWIWL